MTVVHFLLISDPVYFRHFLLFVSQSKNLSVVHLLKKYFRLVLESYLFKLYTQ